MMNNILPKRHRIRIVSFTAALVVCLAGTAIYYYNQANNFRHELEMSYMRSLGELSGYLTNISTDLDKGQYAGTPATLTELSARIWRESGSAKSALSALPVSDLHMDNTYKFLSQVGDYAMALSKKVSTGQTLTEQEEKDAQALREYAVKLREYVDEVNRDIRDNNIMVMNLHHRASDGEEPKTGSLSDGFQNLEQEMTGYPSLIYDGPFSDHLLSQEPTLTRDKPIVPVDKAKEKAARAANTDPADLEQQDDESSVMPSYVFRSPTTVVGVTKSGGYVTYMLNTREIGEQRVSKNIAMQNAERYLEELGVENMRATYYETAEGICTINFAAMEGEVTLYTDLIKIGVALDDGSIVSYDGRGYISNHRERYFDPPSITPEEALKSVNPSLAVQSWKLALIPTSGRNEVLTYEFFTQMQKNPNEDPQKVLVYIDAHTGFEQDILLLLETPNGVLTK